MGVYQYGEPKIECGTFTIKDKTGCVLGAIYTDAPPFEIESVLKCLNCRTANLKNVVCCILKTKGYNATPTSNRELFVDWDVDAECL